MNKIILYCLTLLLYLVLSKSLSPFEYGISYVNEEKQLASLIKGRPVAAILIDHQSTGFAIKTYYLKFKVIYGFESYEELVIRSSNKFLKKYSPYLGLSVFRRYRDGKESFVPQIPGSLFIGDTNYGRWVRKKGIKQWQFFKVYRQIPVYLGWDSYIPNYNDFERIQQSQATKQSYFKDEGLFGPQGVITQKAFSDYFTRSNRKTLTWKDFLKNYFNENFINYKEKL